MNQEGLTFQRFEACKGQFNQYILFSKGEAALIDAVHPFDQLAPLLRERAVELKYLLVTHGHPSYLTSVPRLKELYGAPFCLHPDDSDLVERVDEHLQIDLPIMEGALLRLGVHEIKVLHTPGHTAGSTCFYIKDEGLLFSGETVLARGYGEIWGPNSMRQMVMSLKRLNSVIPGKTRIFPGLGPSTTMAGEAWMNCLRSA